MDFGALPPEINSGRMYTGPGQGPMLAAAAAWDSLATELSMAAAGYGSVVSELASGPWSGPAASSMTAAAAPYVAWMRAAAAQAEMTASQAKAAVAAYEAAFAMTVPPPVIAANRAQLMMLVATNILGQNFPAIAATEAHYGEMWAQDAAAMYGYAATSADSSALTPFSEPPQTTNPGGQGAQAAAVSHAAGTAAEVSGQSTASHVAAAPSGLQAALNKLLGGTSNGSDSPLGEQWDKWVTANDQVVQLWVNGDDSNDFYWAESALSSSSPAAAATTTGGPAAVAGLPGFGIAGGQGGLPFSAGGAVSPGAPVSAGVGNGGTIGQLSVPQSWAASAPSSSVAGTALPAGGVAHPDPANGLLRGLPLTGTGARGSTGPAYKYGFRYPVVARSPVGG